MNATLRRTGRNLAQIRGKNAFAAARGQAFPGREGGEVAKKVPALIVSDGLLATLAFAIDKGGGHAAVFRAVLAHLRDPGIADPTAKGVGEGDLAAWFDALAGASAADLRRATAEALAYLAFLRRFAKREKDDGQAGE